MQRLSELRHVHFGLNGSALWNTAGSAHSLFLLCLVGAMTITWPLVIWAEQPIPGKGTVSRSRAQNLCDRVKTRGEHPGLLRASDVCMRSLRPRPIHDSDPHDTLQAIRDFHVTRLEWTYGLTPEFIAKVRNLGCTVSGACVNGSLAGIEKEGDEWYMPYSAVNLNGEPVEAPWMRAWRGHILWECINNPAARTAYLEYVKSQIDLRVKDLQRDDPTMNHRATRWGACFCKYCIKGFQSYLAQHASTDLLKQYGIEDSSTFDYGQHLRARNAPVGDEFEKYPEDDLKRLFIAFQEHSTIEFHRWWRQKLDEYAGRRVPVSSNNATSDFGPIHSVFDWYVGELVYSRAQPETLYDIACQVERMGKRQTVTMPIRRDSEETREWIDGTRRTIATAYALGMHIEAPWDTYLWVPNAVDPPRYFGKPEEYSDLFALVRAEARLLDGYETAAASGGMIDDDRWSAETQPVTVFSASSRVCAFARALPGKADAPVVVHLVDWSAEPQPFTISLNPNSLFAGRAMDISLVTPKPYDRRAHFTAFETGNYESLVEEVSLAEGQVTICHLPPLRPWGLLVLRPLPNHAGLWPPRFVSRDRQGVPTVSILSPDPDATTRFTTDGTQPSYDSPVYGDPIPVGSCREIRAVCYRGADVSSESIIKHLPAAHLRPNSLLLNGDFSLGTDNWRRIMAQELGMPEPLEFAVEKSPKLDNRVAAKLCVRSSDGVLHHLRLVQPLEVPERANLHVTATMFANRPTRVRFGIRERIAPYRIVQLVVLELDSEPQRFRWNMANSHPDLSAQLQLELGSCEAGTTIWVSDLTVHDLKTTN